MGAVKKKFNDIKILKILKISEGQMLNKKIDVSIDYQLVGFLYISSGTLYLYSAKIAKPQQLNLLKKFNF